MHEETKRADGKAEIETVRFYNGRMTKFRLPAPEEMLMAENNALDRKLADEDFDPYS